MRKMKDSGIEWIGEIPEGWESVRIKNIFTLRNERSFLPLNQVNLISLYTDKGVLQHADIEAADLACGNKASTADGYKKVYYNDIVVNIILCWMGAIGRSQYEGVTSPAYDIYQPSNCIDSRYYHYYFRTSGFNGDCYKYGRGIMAMRWRTYSSEFRAIPVPLPPLPEQQRIADYLDAKCGEIDSAIEKLIQIIEKLQEYKRSLITQVVTKGLNPKAKMKDSGIDWIGEVPEEWEVRRFKNYGTCRNGLTYSPNNLCNEEDGVLVLRSSNIQNGCLVFDDNVYVNSEINEELFVKAGDILICSRNGSAKLIGKNAIIPDGIIASFGAFMMIYRCKNHRYFRYILNSSVFSSNLASFLTATVNQLTTSNFLNMKFCYTSSTTEQNQIVDYLDSKCSKIDAVIAQKQALIEKLTEYKKSLIYEVVTGKREI